MEVVHADGSKRNRLMRFLALTITITVTSGTGRPDRAARPPGNSEGDEAARAWLTAT